MNTLTSRFSLFSHRNQCFFEGNLICFLYGTSCLFVHKIVDDGDDDDEVDELYRFRTL